MDLNSDRTIMRFITRIFGMKDFFGKDDFDMNPYERELYRRSMQRARLSGCVIVIVSIASSGYWLFEILVKLFK